MKRTLAVSLLAVACSIGASGTASANQPTVQRTPFDAQFVDESCGFPVDFHSSGFLVDITWTDANGNVRVIEAAPQATWVLTNTATSKVLRVNIAGPGQFNFNQDGSFKLVGTGTWGWFGNPDTGQAGLFRTTGRFVFSIDPGGVSSFTRVGGLVDLCAQLAP